MPIQQQYPLPENRNPRGTRCLMIDIPDDDEYERLFISAIVRLTWWFMYDRDNTHFGQVIAGLWKAAIKTIRDCQSQEVHTYEDYEAMPRFRDHCDHDLFYIGCDDTEHKIAFADDIPATSQTNGGEPQPAAGGGVQDYCKSFNANAVSLIPALLNAGDIITVESISGSGYDGTGLAWYCSNGNILFADCQPSSGHLDGTDPLPTANHMSLIVKIGSSFYPIGVGSPLTVPFGVANAQGWFQINDADLSNNYGNYQLCYRVQNNATATWCHHFDFAVTNGGFVPFNNGTGDRAAWVSGAGWTVGAVALDVVINRDFASTSIARVVAVITETSACAGGDSFVILYSGDVSHTGSEYFRDTGLACSPGGTLDHSAAVTTGNIQAFLNNNNTSPVSTQVIRSMTIYGTGTNPFGDNNC